jgi:hypothetical protein
MAVKLGDVNASWRPESPVGLQGLVQTTPHPSRLLSAARTDGTGVTFRIGSLSASGSSVQVPINIAGFQDVTSVQFSVEWDPAHLRFRGVSGLHLPGLSEGNFGERYSSQGRLSFSWDDGTGRGCTLSDGSAIFSLNFTSLAASTASDSVRIADMPTRREVAVHNRAVPMRVESQPVLAASSGKDPALGCHFDAAQSEGRSEGFTLEIPTEIGQSYLVESTESLAGAPWEPLAQFLGATEGTTLITDRSPTGRCRFYRVRIVEAAASSLN